MVFNVQCSNVYLLSVQWFHVYVAIRKFIWKCFFRWIRLKLLKLLKVSSSHVASYIHTELQIVIIMVSTSIWSQKIFFKYLIRLFCSTAVFRLFCSTNALNYQKCCKCIFWFYWGSVWQVYCSWDGPNWCNKKVDLKIVFSKHNRA